MARRKSDNRDEGIARAEELLERLRFNRERIVRTIQRVRQEERQGAAEREISDLPRSKS